MPAACRFCTGILRNMSPATGVRTGRNHGCWVGSVRAAHQSVAPLDGPSLRPNFWIHKGLWVRDLSEDRGQEEPRCTWPMEAPPSGVLCHGLESFGSYWTFGRQPRPPESQSCASGRGSRLRRGRRPRSLLFSLPSTSYGSASKTRGARRPGSQEGTPEHMTRRGSSRLVPWPA